MGAVTAPMPLLRPEFHRRSDWIQVDIPGVHDELTVGKHLDALESISKEMTRVPMLSVPVACVFPEQLLHSLRQTTLGYLEQQVEVVRHLAVAKDRPPILLRDAGEQDQMTSAIILGLEDGTAAVAPRRNVIDTSGCYDARRSRHECTIGSAGVPGRSRHTFGTELAHFYCGV